jgi:hypothetical protein
LDNVVQWNHVASELTELARDQTGTRFDERVCELLGSGHVHPLAAALDELETAGDPFPLRIRILRADLAARDQTIELHELLELERAARGAVPADGDLVVWMSAILAEWGLWRGDFATIGYVFGDTEATGDPLGQLAEARRRRIAAIVSMVTDPDGQGTSELVELVHRALDALGCPDEDAMTDCMLGYARLSISDDLSPEPIDLIRHSVKELEAIESDRLPIALAFEAWSTYMMGDFVTCADSLDRYEEVMASGELAVPPVVAEGVAILHGLSRMILDGATDAILAGLDCHLRKLRMTTVPTWFVGPVANDLLDHGQYALAAELVTAAASVPNVMRAPQQSIREVDARVRLLRDRDPNALDELWALYGEWEAVGRARRAAASAVRCSWTCRQAGLTAAAERLHEWGTTRLPDREVWTSWEVRYVDGPNVIDLTSVGGRGKLRVLVPDVTVTRGDREVRLGTMQARLMAVLAAARRPVTTDWVVTALWPEADLEAGRNRLAALVHRIRQRLDLLPDELLRRTRDGLELDGRGWSIDAWTFWDLSAGNPDDQERALELYQSDLAGRQLAYDDLLEEQRDRLRERWTDTVRGLVDMGRLTPLDARDRAHRLGNTIELDP